MSKLEMLQLEAMFPSIKIDFSQFKVTTEVYPQTNKQTVDTRTDNRADFYLPQKGTIVKYWAIVGKMSPVTNSGVDITYDITDNDNATATTCIPHNIPHLIN
jgi:hypothetical protein